MGLFGNDHPSMPSAGNVMDAAQSAGEAVADAGGQAVDAAEDAAGQVVDAVTGGSDGGSLPTPPIDSVDMPDIGLDTGNLDRMHDVLDAGQHAADAVIKMGSDVPETVDAARDAAVDAGPPQLVFDQETGSDPRDTSTQVGVRVGDTEVGFTTTADAHGSGADRDYGVYVENDGQREEAGMDMNNYADSRGEAADIGVFVEHGGERVEAGGTVTVDNTVVGGVDVGVYGESTAGGRVEVGETPATPGGMVLTEAYIEHDGGRKDFDGRDEPSDVGRTGDRDAEIDAALGVTAGSDDTSGTTGTNDSSSTTDADNTSSTTGTADTDIASDTSGTDNAAGTTTTEADAGAVNTAGASGAASTEQTADYGLVQSGEDADASSELDLDLGADDGLGDLDEQPDLPDLPDLPSLPDDLDIGGSTSGSSVPLDPTVFAHADSGADDGVIDGSGDLSSTDDGDDPFAGNGWDASAADPDDAADDSSSVVDDVMDFVGDTIGDLFN
jgi:hypothetical protein